MPVLHGPNMLDDWMRRGGALQRASDVRVHAHDAAGLKAGVVPAVEGNGRPMRWQTLRQKRHGGRRATALPASFYSSNAGTRDVRATSKAGSGAWLGLSTDMSPSDLLDDGKAMGAVHEARAQAFPPGFSQVF